MLKLTRHEAGTVVDGKDAVAAPPMIGAAMPRAVAAVGDPVPML